MVESGHFLECKSFFQATPLEINKTQFHVPLFVIPVQGSDVILGLAWLSSLGPILADFSIPQLSFNVNGSPCVITCQPFAAPVTPSTLHSLIRKNSVASLHAMIYHCSLPLPTTPKPASHPDLIIESLLTKFRPLFEPPHSLPPPRPHDHHIPLAPNTNPINSKPFRYPHYQKEIMTPLIKDMLTDGVIQPRQSPYSSPILLMQKKDGTWRFCVDYRALNAATIRDRFPIPTVDELLDELHGSKIDLRAGYHQIREDPDKLAAIKSWPSPNSFTTLRAFLGLTGYYRRFVPTYAHIASHLTDILKKPSFTWNAVANTAFTKLKDVMTHLITLALTNFSEPFDLTTDASGVAIGTVLSQNDKPISFFRKKSSDRTQANSTYIRELYPISNKKMATISTGSKVLSKENNVADALSRLDTANIMAISSPRATWLDELRLYYKNDPEGQKMIEQLKQNSHQIPQHTHHNGLLYVQGRLFIPNISNIRLLILQEFHASALGGHTGVKATLQCLLPYFYWPTIKADVTDFIKKCSIFQSTKYPTHKPYGLLQPLPTPSQMWYDITMDFITHFPSSNGKTTIWRPAFFKPLMDPIFKQLGTKLRYSSAYHPQTDCQTEVVNRCLEAYLRAFVHDEHRLWNRYLYLAEFWYNTSFHSSIQMTPFRAMYGREATTIHEYTPGSNHTASIDESLREHQRLTTILKLALEHTRQWMSKQANKKRLDKQFQVGDFVYLRLCNYRQNSVAARDNQKLAKRFFGPYRVLEKIGPVAYRLELPITSRVHPVFHVSLLKESHSHTASSEFPSEWLKMHLRMSHNQNQSCDDVNQEILIKWMNHEQEEATWEDLNEISTRFCDFIGHEDVFVL
uniref:Uncharacterized protein n=1 Tax=Tanacetum cinerariifolium TaxID=118510 RepID=A0A6L2MAI4_TANCI|nr:hypothetical protein [Tanacetum cinerariifolium]